MCENVLQICLKGKTLIVILTLLLIDLKEMIRESEGENASAQHSEEPTSTKSLMTGGVATETITISEEVVTGLLNREGTTIIEISAIIVIKDIQMSAANRGTVTGNGRVSSVSNTLKFVRLTSSKHITVFHSEAFKP